MRPYDHCNIIHSGQDMETTTMSSDRDWIKKLWYIYTMEHYTAMRKDEILPFVTVWTDLKNSMLSEISQSEKAESHMISLICGI